MPGYDDFVFINCPFDDAYQKLFRATVFAVADCGFVPRCALEKSGSGETRIEKLYRIISECRYGIHDISATELDPVHQLPRFNMPLELGIFLGAKRYGPSRQQEKGCLILDREQYRYQKFCSDIAGQDPKPHEGDPAKAVRCVRNWLKDERPDEVVPSGRRIFNRYRTFCSDLPLVADALHLDADELQFNDLTMVVFEWLLDNSW